MSTKLSEFEIALLTELRSIARALRAQAVHRANGTKLLLTDEEAAARLCFRRYRNSGRSRADRFMDRMAETLKLGKPIKLSRRRHWSAEAIDNAIRRLAKGKRGRN